MYPIADLDHYETPATAVLGPFEETVLAQNRRARHDDAARPIAASPRSPTSGLDRWGAHSVACVPMRSSGGVVGLMSVVRDGESRFTDAEKQVLQTFADQAVIAIENSRLFRELEASNREVSAALEQQTAVAAVLQTISRSAFDLDAVLNEFAEQAHRLVDGYTTVLNVYRDQELVPAATVGMFDDALAREGLALISQVIDGGRPFYFTARQGVFAAEFPKIDALMVQRGLDALSVAVVPLMSGGECLGAVSINRAGDVSFTDAEKQLLQTFADQAVIAIENARLFSELEDRNRDVSEALELQTAIAEVLEIISSSPTDLEPVLADVLTIAGRLCDADMGIVWQSNDRRFLIGASHGLTAEEFAGASAVRYLTDAIHAVHRVASGATVRTTRDGIERYVATARADPTLSCDVEFLGIVRPGAALMVPLTRGGSFSGVFSLFRRDDRPFTDRDEEIVQTFADQAVIAIQNSHLFHELEQSNQEVNAALEQQTAVAAVLQTISRSAFDLDAVLDELTRQVHHMLDADVTTTALLVGDRLSEATEFPVGAGMSFLDDSEEDFLELTLAGRPRFGFNRGEGNATTRTNFERFGMFSVAIIPLVGADGPLGLITVTKLGEHWFTDSEKQLLQTFADQAVIAIENARLFSELQAKTEELEIASRHKSEFLANMSHELRTPLNAIIGYAELIAEECEDLGAEEFLPDLGKIQSAGQHLLTLISGILDLAKVEAGRMDLFVETVDIAAMLTRGRPDRAPVGGEEPQHVRARLPGRGRDLRCRPGEGEAGAVQPAVERGEVHRGRHDHARRHPPHRPGRTWHGRVRRLRHRHRDVGGAAGQAVRGVLAGRRVDHAQVRRHWPGARAQPQLLSDDGRRHHGYQRARRRVDLHRHHSGGVSRVIRWGHE